MDQVTNDVEFCVVSRRNNSLSKKQRWSVFALLCTGSLLVAGVVMAFGAWPVLPYSVLELTLVAASFWYFERRSKDWERLTITGNCVVFEAQRGSRFTRQEFSRYWLRVENGRRNDRNPCVQLRLGSNRLEFGRELPPAERLALARKLRQLLALH